MCIRDRCNTEIKRKGKRRHVNEIIVDREIRVKGDDTEREQSTELFKLKYIELPSTLQIESLYKANQKRNVGIAFVYVCIYVCSGRGRKSNAKRLKETLS